MVIDGGLMVATTSSASLGRMTGQSDLGVNGECRCVMVRFCGYELLGSSQRCNAGSVRLGDTPDQQVRLGTAQQSVSVPPRTEYIVRSTLNVTPYR
ncbi:hypothetical protein Aco03nite_102530 [Actinoplanes couchii]|uniref:Uncharacterized protein n=1 Tax=Actinoplanes couchii TaxID=403638 RepID=A0ABQ3XTM5_9ACTN|nr:hypothetical protein Aco03nite_102530 [Actinoplanes couchii]